MSDNLLFPKDLARAAKRWSPDALAGASAGASLGPSALDPATSENARLAQVRERARREGFEQGFASGAQAANQEAERFTALALGLQKSVASLEATIATSLLDLAVDIARQVVRTELLLHRDSVLGVVHEAIRSVPEGTLNGEVLLNPEDAELVRTRMHEELKLGLWRIVPTPELAPGSVRISTRQCDVDATLPTRWRQAMQSLGREDSWKKTSDDA